MFPTLISCFWFYLSPNRLIFIYDICIYYSNNKSASRIQFWDSHTGLSMPCPLSELLLPYPVRSVSWHPPQHIFAAAMVSRILCCHLDKVAVVAMVSRILCCHLDKVAVVAMVSRILCCCLERWVKAERCRSERWLTLSCATCMTNAKLTRRLEDLYWREA